MNNYHKVAAIVEHLALGTGDNRATTTCYDDGAILNIALHTPWNYETDKGVAREFRVLARRLKRIFGPLKAEGEPPWVVIEGKKEMDGIEVTFRITGAFECKENGYTTEVVEAKPATPARTQKIPTYGCRPIAGIKMEDLEDAPDTVAYPAPDPGSDSGYEPGT